MRGGGACEREGIGARRREHHERKGLGAGETSIIRLKLRQKGGEESRS